MKLSQPLLRPRSQRSRKPWSQREDELLLNLIKGGRSAVQVAAALLRTTRGIRTRAEDLRISWKTREIITSK